MAYKRPQRMMRKVISMMSLLVMFNLCLSSCSKDDVDLGSFDYPTDELFGTWDASIIHVKGSLRWIAVSEYTRDSMSITFKRDGNFSGEG